MKRLGLPVEEHCSLLVTEQQVATGDFGTMRARRPRRPARGRCRVYPAPVAVNLDGDESTWVEPDAIAVCDPANVSERGCEGAPDMVCEVVSPSSRRMDYVDKMWRYARAGVREYRVVDPTIGRTTVYRFEQGTTPAIFPFAQPVPASLFEGLEIVVERFL